MSDYFSKFPTITYAERSVYDITRRNNFIRDTLGNPLLFLPYTIKEGEKPEDIANLYYGSVDYTWLVLMANNMLDPYHDWPMSQEVFYNYLIDKYSELSKKKGIEVVHWCMSELNLDNVVYYYREENGKLVKISKQTLVYNYLLTERGDILTTEDDENLIVDVQPPAGYQAYRIFDYENDLNENKREILLVDRQYASKIDTEFRKLMKK